LACGPPQKPISGTEDEEPTQTITLFFGKGLAKSESGSEPTSMRDARSDFGFVNVSGQEVLERSTIQSGFGRRFGPEDLSELRRRTGLTGSMSRWER